MPRRPQAERLSRACLLALALSACGVEHEADATDAAREEASEGTTRDGAASLDGGSVSLDGGSDSAPGEGGAVSEVGGSLYSQVSEIFGRSCGYLRCHAGPIVGAGLDLSPGSDYRAQLVDVVACEYDGMRRVEPGAPERSWLMVKLTAPFRPLDDPYALQITFAPPPGWDETRRGCRDQRADGAPLFGQRMPSTAPNMLPEPDLAVIRRWIAEGAPP